MGTYDLGDVVYVVDRYNKYSVKSGKIRSIRTTTYKRYGSTGDISRSLYIEYNLAGSWFHDVDVFSDEAGAKQVSKAQLELQLVDIQTRLYERNRK